MRDHLAENNIIITSTTNGFLVDDPGGFDVAVVVAGSSEGTSYTVAEAQAIRQYVENGGGLLIMADSVPAWNVNIQPVATEFGVSIGISDTGDDFNSDFDPHPIFSGVSQYWTNSAGEISAAAPLVEVGWEDGSSRSRALVAVGEVGQGRVVVIGDESLWTLGDFHLADNPQFALSVFSYLAVPEPASASLSVAWLLLLSSRRIRK